jgi:hypothetical protein
MTMLRLDRAQRKALGDTLRQLANLVAGALVLGPFVGQRPASVTIAAAGIAIWIVFVVFGLWLAGERADV